MPEQKNIGVALVGCGTVGSGVATLLTRDADLLTRRSGLTLELRHLVDKDFARAREAGIDEAVFREDLSEALADQQTSIVIELVGGTTIAKDIVEQALAAGKHVVTANKALLAHHGKELYALASEHGVCIAFEASCVGGVPVIGALTNGLLANNIEALYGIVNGTCNYILSEMTDAGAGYGDVLADAQAQGLAEADPTLDVKGIDSAHKLAILAALAFGESIDFDKIYVEGIDQLELVDVFYGLMLEYRLKLLAIAERQDDGISLRVHPAFIADRHPLAGISGPFNAVSVYGHATGHTMYYGRGAGGMPTASAVMADVLDVALGNAPRRFEQLGIWPDRCQPAVQLPIEQVMTRYYLRMIVEDRPGVFAQIAEVLGRHGISITSVIQQEPPEDAAGVPVIITIDRSAEGDVRNALGEIAALPVLKAEPVMIRIVDEYPEPQV